MRSYFRFVVTLAVVDSLCIFFFVAAVIILLLFRFFLFLCVLFFCFFFFFQAEDGIRDADVTGVQTCALPISLWCFAFLTGMSASVVRAVMMFSIMGFGQLMGKKFFGLHAIFASALLLLIFNPLVLFDIGFQLSYLAVLGISLFYQPIVKLFTSSHKIINWFWQGTVIGIAAQIGTVPISLIYFNQFPNYFLLTNIGLLVLAFIAFIGVLVLFISHLIPMLVDALSYLVNLIFDILTYFITWINSLPGEVSTGFTPHILQVALLYIAILFSLYQWQKGNFKKFIFTVLFLFVLSVSLIYNRENNKFKKELIVLNH